MVSLQLLQDNLNVAHEYYDAQNFAVSVPICQNLLAEDNLPLTMAVECHIMLAMARIPGALEHSVSANIIARELLSQFPDDESYQELYDISQDMLRIAQQQSRENRDLLTQQILAHSGNSNNQPLSEPASSTHLSSPPRTRRRRRASTFSTNLTTISEEPEEEGSAREGPGEPVYHNRYLSSLSCAAGNLEKNIDTQQRK